MFLAYYSVRFFMFSSSFHKNLGSNFGTKTYLKVTVTEKVYLEEKV